MHVLHCGPAQEEGGWSREGLCPQLEEDKGRRNPNHNPVGKSRPSGTWRERDHVGPQRGAALIKVEEVVREGA